MTTKKTWAVYVTVLLGAIGAVVLSGSATATQTGDVYGGSGTWTINNPTTLDGETVTVSGRIKVYRTFRVRNGQIEFSVPNAVITVYGASGSLIMGGASDLVTVTTTNANQYFNFSIQTTASTVNLQNVTLDHIWNGVVVNSGDAVTRYFSDVTITNAVNYGMQLSNSNATLFNIYVSLLISSSLTTSESWTNYTYSGFGYMQFIKYHYLTRSLTASGTGVRVIGGSPWVDGVEVHVPDVNQRLDVTLMGGIFYEYSYYYSYGCGSTNFYNYTYTYDTLSASVNINGFYSQNAMFAHFDNVVPPTENFSIEIHWSLGGSYGFQYYYCDIYPSQSYSYPDNVVYGFNRITFSTANVIGVYVQNGGLTSLDGLNYAMGRVGISFVNDWTGGQSYADYFMQYYVSVTSPQVYALWSVGTLTTTAFAMVTSTDFSLTNSYFTGAGVRVDRNFNYNTPAAPGGANDTVFRGTVLVDNVTVLRASATAIDVRLSSVASSTYNRFEYTAVVEDSTISATRALSLSLLNRPSTNSNYTAAITIRNNAISDGLSQAGINYLALVMINTGGHSSSMSSDWYKADVLLENNAISDSKGPVIGWDYSSYRFGGGSTLTLANNSFTNVSYYWQLAVGGGRTGGSPNDAFIKATVEAISIVGNTFRDFSFVYGMLGGSQGASSSYEYIAFSYCARYGYTGYGCSWPYKTPTIDVTDNTFQTVVMESTGVATAFVLIPGRGYVTFDRNVVNDSSATFIHLFLNDYSYYSFPVEDLSAMVRDNVISNQTLNPFGYYTHPYKSGMPYEMVGNVYSDSSASFVKWKSGWFGGVSQSPVGEYGATFRLADNLFMNLSLGNDGAAHLTGRMTITNNTFDGVSGWAVIAELMSRIPGLSGNTVIRSTNGFWLVPALSSGIIQTVT